MLVLLDDMLVVVFGYGTGLVAVWFHRDWHVPPYHHGRLQAPPGTPILPLSTLLSPSSPLGCSYWLIYLLRCCCLLAMPCCDVLFLSLLLLR